MKKKPSEGRFNKDIVSNFISESMKLLAVSAYVLIRILDCVAIVILSYL